MTAPPFRDFTFDSLLRWRAGSSPESVFLVDGQTSWTYAQAQQAASGLAAGLRGLGLQPGDRLAMILPNTGEAVLTYFGAAHAGLIVVPINVRRSPEELLARLTRTRPKAIVAPADPSALPTGDAVEMLQTLQPQLPYTKDLILVGGTTLSWEQLAASPEAIPPASRPESPSVIVHTLGSSGAPRGAVLGHAGMVRNAAAVAAALDCNEADVFLGAVPFSNVFGITPTILSCVIAGARLICLHHYEPGAALDAVERYAVTVHHGVPTMFALELNHPAFRPERCRSLRTGVMSGAACPPALVRRVQEAMGMRVVIGYGLTEASPAVTMTRLDDGPVTASETAGRPLEDVEVRVVDPAGAALPAGAEGELCVRGYNVMQGYWEDPQITAQVLDGDGWLHTGDLATIDADSVVRILGRKDDAINRAGFTIYPGPVEMVLRSFPGVREAAVVGVPDVIYGEITCACVVPAPGERLDPEALRAYAAERLAEYAVPDRVLILDALPRRGSGPVMRGYLRERVRIRGRAWTFGRNVDTDAIIPARRCNTVDPRELARYCMEDADPQFAARVQRGDLIVADSNFGCGSSREVAPISIKAAGVSAVIARSFARIFFRNAINIGLPILECPAAVDGIEAGDEVEAEPAAGVIRNLTRGTVFQAVPYPEFLQRIIQRGGLLAYVEDRLAEKAG